ncbi:MAG: Txe/YoeB family addiction module toxin [Flavobacterium sp.]
MTYCLNFTEQFDRDYKWHKKSGNKTILIKITKLLQELSEHPFIGTGKPEQLKHDLTGKWSRRITGEHRLIYQVIENNVIILSVKGHYE